MSNIVVHKTEYTLSAIFMPTLALALFLPGKTFGLYTNKSRLLYQNLQFLLTLIFSLSYISKGFMALCINRKKDYQTIYLKVFRA